jgi:hypothetical protein
MIKRAYKYCVKSVGAVLIAARKIIPKDMQDQLLDQIGTDDHVEAAQG